MNFFQRGRQRVEDCASGFEVQLIGFASAKQAVEVQLN